MHNLKHIFAYVDTNTTCHCKVKYKTYLSFFELTLEFVLFANVNRCNLSLNMSGKDFEIIKAKKCMKYLQS